MPSISRLLNMLMCVGLIGLLLLQPIRVRAGGWGVTTIDDMPYIIVAGEKIELRLSVRQHGVHLLGGISPVLRFRNGTELVMVQAVADGAEGYYVAQVRFPKPGEWQWEVTSFPPQRMAPLTVVDKWQYPLATRLARQTLRTEQGQLALGKTLFMTKGCYVCHAHASITKSGQFSNAYPFGSAPDLTRHTLSAEYLRLWLKNPQAIKPQTQMPNLGLKTSEVSALAAFLSAK